MTDLARIKQTCGDWIDRFPCKTCGATVPVECPHYTKFRTLSPKANGDSI